MKVPAGEQLPRPRSEVESQPADAFRMTVNLKDVKVSLNLPEGPLTSAKIKVEVPNLNPVEMSYSVHAGFSQELARIHRQYSVPGIDHDDEVVDGDQSVSISESPFANKDGKHLRQILTGLLQWQEALELAGALGESADLRNLGDDHDRLIENLQSKYVDRMGKLRDELLSQRNAVPILRKWLQSGNDALINLAIQVARDPVLRTAVQGDLARVAGDDGRSPQTRQRARAYLRRWRQRGTAGVGGHADPRD